jgi:IS5 family transposase
MSAPLVLGKQKTNPSKGADMRTKLTSQMYLNFVRKSSLKVVEAYRAKYEGIDKILSENPAILSAAHREISKKLSESSRGRSARYTSDEIFRALIVMFIEADSYRDVVVRIENSEFLRDFVGLGGKPMMDFTFLSRAFGSLSPRTWSKINEHLSAYAMAEKKISGEKLRVDTTVYETNIHYPTDSSLLWDGFRTLSRLLRLIRKSRPELSLSYRFHDRKVKRLNQSIHRNAAGGSRWKQRQMKKAYRKLLAAVERLLGVCDEVVRKLPRHDGFAQEILVYQPLVRRVMDQARRRVFLGENVSARQKLYSLFEPHTELIKRGKARSPIEFGHKVLLGQTKEKFISQYHVMKERTEDKDLLDMAIDAHEARFGEKPKVLAADKGFYESQDQLKELSKAIETVSICKKGRRNGVEQMRERSGAFKAGQRFRAGIEGTISVLKRGFKLFRCLFRGFKHYASSVGGSVFCHNIVLLTRL